jgi:L-2-hydroxyglutarate oxidase
VGVRAVAWLTRDVVVVGGGIVGLATAWALRQARPDLGLAVLEKEPGLGRHQSGHNSGVIHSGIYYRPGSLKARLAVEGARRMVAFCREHGIRHAVCGKVIVAVEERELPVLDELARRGQANGVPGVSRLDPAALREVEPAVRGLAALHVASTGIADYPAVVETLARLLRDHGVEVIPGVRVLGGRPEGSGLRLETSRGAVLAGRVVNCAGLYADRVARSLGAEPGVRIVPFRGEYHLLAPGRQDLVRGLVYPVPDPRLPFLGVHFTRRVDGSLEAGPNAVLAWAREGYSRLRLHPGELWETLTFPGFRRLVRRYGRQALEEYRRSFSKAAFAQALARLVPSVRPEDLRPGGAGVRAQAVDAEGRLLDDFHLVRDERAVHVLNAPSPAATASLAIGEHLAALAVG